MATNTATSEAEATDWTGLAIIILCVGSLSVLGFVLLRQVRQVRHRRPPRKTPPVELALNAFSDQYDGHQDEENCDEDNFVGANLPHLA